MCLVPLILAALVIPRHEREAVVRTVRVTVAPATRSDQAEVLSRHVGLVKQNATARTRCEWGDVESRIEAMIERSPAPDYTEWLRRRIDKAESWELRSLFDTEPNAGPLCHPART